jgi:hypothetical protein
VAPRTDRSDPAPSSLNDATQPPSVTVGHDGKIDGIYRPSDQRRPWTRVDRAQYELREPTPRDDPAPPDPLASRRGQASRRKKRIAIAVITAALLAPVAGYVGLRLWNDYKARSAKASGLIFIDSRPSNARLFIDGAEVGRTPYVAPNTFRPGSTVSVHIVYPGAQEWSGTFPGGVDTSFTADLQAE